MSRRVRVLELWMVVVCLLVAACDSSQPSSTVRLQGAGASFPAPLYRSWIEQYNAASEHVLVDYQSVGSGSGVKSLVDGTVDFAASDAAMTPEEMARVERGVELFPVTAGSIVITYNLEGVEGVRLSREVYPKIFLGAIDTWNHPAIAADNPGRKLPDKPINVVVRADSSGTTFVFTKHLSAVSEAFAEGPGTHKMPAWPVGIRAKGNEGVTASVETTPGAIGYVEYGYAKSQGLPMVALENQTGQFIEPTTASGQAALLDTQLPSNLIAWNVDPKAPDAYPIATYTWLILYGRYDDARKLEALRGFVRFGLTEGQRDAEKLGYIPLPEAVRAKVLARLDDVKLVAER